MDGTKSGEPIFLVKSGDKVTLHFCDLHQVTAGGRAWSLPCAGWGSRAVRRSCLHSSSSSRRTGTGSGSDFGRLAETPGTRCGRHLRAVNRREECAGASAADRTLVMMGARLPQETAAPLVDAFSVVECHAVVAEVVRHPIPRHRASTRGSASRGRKPGALLPLDVSRRASRRKRRRASHWQTGRRAGTGSEASCTVTASTRRARVRPIRLQLTAIRAQVAGIAVGTCRTSGPPNSSASSCSRMSRVSSNSWSSSSSWPRSRTSR